ncbi:MAG TPA: hypothetical protein VHG32_02810, partial [Thermoanaerobaculia bacterium]|nr:hypothetical protein [Thermoanaerobaculia bacterium]
MALTRHSARACFLWKNRADDLGPGTAAQRLWAPFLQCLEGLQDPCSDAEERTGAPPGVKATINDFLGKLLAAASDGTEPAELQEGLEHQRPLAVLAAWRREDQMGRDVPKRLFGAPRDQGAVAFYLGQLAFLLGQLRLAKAYAVEAYELLQRASEDDQGGRQARQKELGLRILEFLTVTLAIEVAFHSEGYGTFRDQDGHPLAQRIQVELTDAGSHYLEGFPRTAVLNARHRVWSSRGDGRRAAQAGTEPIEEYVKHYWLPVPTDQDLEPVEGDPSKLEPSALAYVLSRQNRAGMLLFRYRSWLQAKEMFEQVVQVLEQRRKTGPWDAMLTPLWHEALLYLGRLEAQVLDFSAAEEKIDLAEPYFSAVGDEFAQNKARKARAELRYRQYRWAEAEALLLQVWRESRAKGFGHDQASTEVLRAKMLSRFGFQEDAGALLASANVHFRRYDVLRESMECLFWQIIIHARWLDLTGHPREHVVMSRALMKVYRSLFMSSVGRQLARGDELSRLGEALRDKRHPDISEALLVLRLGAIPSEDLVRSLRKIAGASTSTISSALQGRLAYQLLRLICLQQREDRPRVSRAAQQALAKQQDEKRLRKSRVRDEVLSALEGIANPRREGDYVPACLALQEACRGAANLGLGGGLVPFLVDLSQCFVERDCFVALLLLLLEAVDGAIRVPTPVGHRGRNLDTVVLKEAYRSLVKYLVLERTFYLGPPPFQEQATSKLWPALRKRERRNWAELYRAMSKGEHGISYPTLAVALGWVESVGSGGASLRVFWVEECLGRPLRQEDFQRIEVPIEVVAQGHAESRMALIALIGRHGDPGDERTRQRPWTAH